MTYQKYGGHCAYCGKVLNDIKDMQVDHIIPQKKRGDILGTDFKIDNIDNYNPSCRRCNHYKRALDLEQFRNYIKTLHERIEKDYIVKVGLDYGIVEINPFDGVFYFEKVRSNTTH